MTAATQYRSGGEWLAACRLYARRNASCLTEALLSMVPREAPGLGTMAVTADAKLLYDPELRNAWTVKQGATVLFHEVWHLLRRHHARYAALKADPKLWNVAGDAEINDDVPQQAWEFPACTVNGKPARPVMPSMFGCPDGDLAEAYYERLRDLQEQQKQQSGGGERGKKGKKGGKGKQQEAGSGGGEQKTDGEEHPGDAGSGGAGNEAPGPGWCGSGAGRPVPDEPEQDGKGRTQAELERLRRATAEAIRAEAAKGRGAVPGGWAVWAESQLRPPKIPWQQKLAKIARGHVEWAAGAVDYRYNAASRRQGGVGFGPGRPVLPALRAPKPEVLVIVDTSGSMGRNELTAGLSEVKAILDTTAARVTFAAADAAVHELRQVRQWRDVLPLLKGGGGTDFRPAFEAAQKMRPRPNVVVFVTDGDGACHETQPFGLRTVWLLVGKHRRSPCSWGEQVEIDD